MTNKHLLIIEDKLEEANVAQENAKSLGIETRLAQDFSSALDEIKLRPAAIASDLFFPAGNINQESYINQVLPIYENYLKTFRPLTDGPLVKVLQFIFPDQGNLTKEQFFEDVIKKYFLKDYPEHMVEVTRDAYFGIENYTRYSKLQEHIGKIKQGIDMPYGLFATEEARKLNIPLHIVTSTNHHDIAFQPLRDKLGNYTDNLVDGHKNWASTFNQLSEYLKGGTK
jgi:hypothetical protein